MGHGGGEEDNVAKPHRYWLAMANQISHREYPSFNKGPVPALRLQQFQLPEALSSLECKNGSIMAHAA